MNDFRDFLNEMGIIPNLMNHYGITLKDNEVHDFIYNLVENLSLTESNENHRRLKSGKQNFNLDAIAKSYEKIVPHSQRKTMGEFYTPIQIVDYILKSVGYTNQQDIENKNLIDLSCGSGSFLVRAVEILGEKLRKQLKVRDYSELVLNQAINIIDRIKNNIIGIDVNPIACVLCQFNIYFTIFDLFNNILEKKNDYKIPVFNIFNEDTLQFNFRSKYDFVVGNPPYLFIRAIPQDYRNFIEKLPLETNKGQYDYYQIFIELGIKTLKKGGKMGYIVPDSLLALSNRKLLRKYIYNHTKIKEICVVGSGFRDPVVSNIILVLKKEVIEEQRLNNKIMIKKALKTDQRENFLLQKNIGEWDYKFLIHLTQNDIEILKHLNSSFTSLKDLILDSQFDISINRGVELGKKGEVVYCDTCNRYFPLPKGNFICVKCGTTLNSNDVEKIIVDSIPKGLENAYQPFIYSINRYFINEYRYIKVNVGGINYKDLSNYNNRIAVRQLNQENLICAAYEKNALSSQSIYNIKINQSPIAEFNHFYLLGLLNSRLLSFYFLKTFGSYKLLFPRILIEKLKILPIKVPSTKKEKELSDLIKDKVNQILNLKNRNETQVLKLQNKIDLHVNNLYQINEDDYHHILNSLDNLVKNKY
ncbi:MAG: N-6 DNA methylase [Candidatus Lokiarchaeota archaeon]|nr:N-6 DNA methylase [Candidatus Lokiarchaeota archaeon]